MPDAFAIELGTGADAPAAAELWVRANAARRGRGPDDHAGQRAQALDVIRGRLAIDGAWLLIARDGRPVGMAFGLPARDQDGAGPLLPGVVHLSMVAVEPADWGRGAGTALIERSVAEAVAGGAHRIQLWTQADNERALRLYERLGFVRTGRTNIDHRGEPIVHLARDLGSS